MGKTFKQIEPTDRELWPFNIIEKDDKPTIKISYKGETKKLIPQHISSILLAEMKATAEAYIGTTVKNVVITVPAYFNNSQRQATIEAGTIAGLNVIHIINEPTAAAIAYRYHEEAFNHHLNKKARNILVFDLGGGTFDVSLVKVTKEYCIKVMATNGDTHLGGVDFDNNVVTHFVEEFKKVQSKDIKGDRKALERLRVACENAKMCLSSLQDITVDVDCLFEGVDFFSTLSRDKFEELNKHLFEKCIEAVEKCLKDVGKDKSYVDDIVLVGGSTRIPKIQQLLKSYFDEKVLYTSLNQDEVVASGAAIQAARLSDVVRYQNLKIYDVTPFNICTRDTRDELFDLIPRNKCIPMNEKCFWRCPVNNQRNIALQVYENVGLYLFGEFIFNDINPNSIGSCLEMWVDCMIDADNIISFIPRKTSDSNMPQLKFTYYNGKLPDDKITYMTEEVKKYRMEATKLKNMRKAKFLVEKFVWTTLPDLLSFHEKFVSELRRQIQETNQWLELDSPPNDARKYEDKLNELQNFINLNKVLEAGSSDLHAPTDSNVSNDNAFSNASNNNASIKGYEVLSNNAKNNITS